MSQATEGTTKKVFLSSAKMAVATFISRILGLVREQLMAHLFGASGLTDAFLVAYRLPNMLRDLFAEGAFSSAFVPIFTEVNQKDPKESDRLFWSMALFLSLATGTVSLLLYVFAEPIVAYVAPTYKNTPELFEVTVMLTKIMAPFLLLVSLAALAMGALNTQKIFFIPALSPALFNLFSCLCMLGVPAILVSKGYNAIYSLGLGVMIGGVAQLGLQIPLILKRVPFRGPIKLWGEYPKKIISRLGIGTIGIAAAQINILINTILATSTVVGAVSWLTYAFRLFQFPVGMLGVSIAGSNLVHFSEAWKKGQKEQAISFLQSSYNLLLLALLPATAILYALAEPIVHLIFMRGLFGIEDVSATTLAFRYYLLGLPFYGIYKVFAPTFYTLDKPTVAVIFSVFAIFVNVLFSWFAVPHWGFSALALGTGLAMTVNVLCQAVYLKKHLSLKVKFFFTPIVCKSIGAMFLTSFVLQKFVHYYPHQASLLKRIFILAGLSCAGVGVFIIIPIILGETSAIKQLWMARKRKKNSSNDSQKSF